MCWTEGFLKWNWGRCVFWGPKRNGPFVWNWCVELRGTLVKKWNFAASQRLTLEVLRDRMVNCKRSVLGKNSVYYTLMSIKFWVKWLWITTCDMKKEHYHIRTIWLRIWCSSIWIYRIFRKFSPEHFVCNPLILLVLNKWRKIYKKLCFKLRVKRKWSGLIGYSQERNRFFLLIINN